MSDLYNKMFGSGDTPDFDLAAKFSNTQSSTTKFTPKFTPKVSDFWGLENSKDRLAPVTGLNYTLSLIDSRKKDWQNLHDFRVKHALEFGKMDEDAFKLVYRLNTGNGRFRARRAWRAYNKNPESFVNDTNRSIYDLNYLSRLDLSKEENPWLDVKATAQLALNNVTPNLPAQLALNNVTPQVTRPATDWNAIAVKNGFKDMDAVKEFQRLHGLVADGKFGRNTKAAYIKSLERPKIEYLSINSARALGNKDKLRILRALGIGGEGVLVSGSWGPWLQKLWNKNLKAINEYILNRMNPSDPLDEDSRNTYYSQSFSERHPEMQQYVPSAGSLYRLALEKKKKDERSMMLGEATQLIVQNKY